MPAFMGNAKEIVLDCVEEDSIKCKAIISIVNRGATGEIAAGLQAWGI